MAINPFNVKRHLPQSRIAAYECTIRGTEISQGKRAADWYGKTVSETRLRDEIIPELDELVTAGRFAYPFVIVSYDLEPDVEVDLGQPARTTGKGRKVRMWGQNFTTKSDVPRRRRRGPEKRVAVVEGPDRLTVFG